MRLALTILTLCHLFTVQAQQQLLESEPLGDSLLVSYYLVADNLVLPWEVASDPGGQLWFSHRYGTIARLDPQSGESTDVLRIPDISRDGGLESSRMVGLVLDIDFEEQPYVYLSYGYFGDAYNAPINHNRYLKVVRYRYELSLDELLEPKVLIDGIKVFDGYHIGGKIIMTADRHLLITVGDAKQPENPELHPYRAQEDVPLPQDLDQFSGKILRINADGSIPTDNPFADGTNNLTAGNLIYSYGHRNTQGLCTDGNGKVYYSEHGGRMEDEVGTIQPGGNYGWPYAEGQCNGLDFLFDETIFCDTAEHIHSWNPDIAPSSLEYLKSDASGIFNHALVIPSLTSEGDGLDLRVLFLNEEGDEVHNELILADGMFGRLRDVAISPTGEIYFTTSNRMWGDPASNDDRIIRLEVSRVEEPLAVTRSEPTPYRVNGNGSDQVDIELMVSGRYELEVFTLTGIKRHSDFLSNGHNWIMLDDGVYIFCISDSRKVYQEKIAIKH